MFDILKLKELEPLILLGTNPTALTDLNSIQIFLNNNYYIIEKFWWALFILTSIFLLRRFCQESLVFCKNTPVSSFCSNRKNITNRYKSIFSLNEVENSLTLRLFGGALMLAYLKTFSFWMVDFSITASGVTNGQSLCWPFFQGCESFIFLERTPNGYSQPTVYMFLYGLIFLSTYGLLAKKIILSHACTLVLFLWSLYTILISYNYNYAANYTYYLVIFSFIFLFCSDKRFFACLSIVLFYFLSTVSKISDTWILGTYFTSLQLGLPLFPKSITPILTNLVILMEMVGAWFLFSRNKILQRSIFAFFVIFHLYSGILVSYHYPTMVLPPLLIFFGPLFEPFKRLPSIRFSFIGWAFILMLFFLQSISYLIPGDRRLTMEGNFYGLFMYEANHQCLAKVKNSEVVLSDTQDANANHRCDPYKILKRSQKSFCRGIDDVKYEIEILHSINGGPFYQIVDENNLCALEYKPFSKNEWIKTEETAPALYRPAENYSY